MDSKGSFQDAIAQLRELKRKIEIAIEVLESLGQDLPAIAGEPSDPKPEKPGIVAKPPTLSPVFGKTVKRRRKKKDGPSTYDLVRAELRKGPKRSGAVIAALKGQATPASIYTMLSYLNSHGEAKRNGDQTYSLVE